MDVLNINVGLLGHVDSGKTSIAKSLSTTSSTACFDKSPQSQERGITIDLGFSSLTIDLPQHLVNSKCNRLQFTLVDCPGHASLIRTIIGGVQIIDMILLVVDITKGVQTQTAECLIIGEIIQKPLLVVLNKIDLIEESKRSATIEKVSKKMSLTLANTRFKGASIVAISANCGVEGGDSIAKDALISKLCEMSTIPVRHPDKPLVYSVDHCFSIKGKGTVMTGTILQGSIKINDEIEIPALGMTRKVKSLQQFHKNVNKGHQGDRIGVCVTQFDPKLLERGLACSPGQVGSIHAAIVQLTPIKYYKSSIKNKTKYHIMVGFETVLGTLGLFKGDGESPFSFDSEYSHLESIEVEDFDKKQMIFALLELESPVIVWENSLLIGSKLDVDVHTSTCRIAFNGNLVHTMRDSNYASEQLPKLKVFKTKEKTGSVQRVVNETEVIVQNLFKKETDVSLFLNLNVTLSTGEEGVIESTFGSTGKVKVRVPRGLEPSTQELFKKKKSDNSDPPQSGKEVVGVCLKFKKYLYDKRKTIIQK